MARGGARNRGPLVRSPLSEPGRLRRAGALVLPSEGYTGDPPAFPLPDASERELDVWREAWRSPQAYAWSSESWRWRAVALWARWSVRMEDPDAPAALGNVVVRLADQIGFTPAGLSENAWRIEDSADAAPARVTPGTRTQRAGISSLERARRRAEDRQRDPRDALRDDPSS